MISKNESQLKKFLSVFLTLLIFSIPVLAQVAQSEEQRNALIDGEWQADQDTNKLLWFGVGCIGSLVGLAIASLIDPAVPQAPLLGKSPEYVASYSDAYKRKVKSIRTNYGLYGCGASILTYGLFYLILFVWFAAEAETYDYYYYYQY